MDIYNESNMQVIKLIETDLFEKISNFQQI